MEKVRAGRLGYCKPGLEATEHPSTRDIAWAAGIFEGEGSVSSARSCILAIEQKDPWILWRLKALFGGNVYRRSTKEIWGWQVSGARARGFMMTIFVFLSPRRKEQIKTVLK
jgi:hypothetical protein